MATEVVENEFDYPLTNNWQGATRALRKRDIAMLIWLSTLFRDLRDEVTPTCKEASSSELSELRDRVIEAMERAMSDPGGPGLEVLLRPWINELGAADFTGVKLVFEGMLRWLEEVLDHLKEVLRRARLAVIADEWE